MTTEDITTLRLLNQQIINGRTKSPLEIIKSLGAMQAQDYYGSLWALGLRTGQTEKESVQAIEAGAILRTWPQRGTLHFVPAEDARWLVSLSAERLLKGAKRRREQLGLDDATLLESQKVLTGALQNNRQLSRPAVMDVLEASGISTKAGRGYHILWYLSQTGITCIGPMAAKQQTISLLDIVAPLQKELTRRESIVELSKRYFTSHGPATVQDFMWWSGLTAADVKTGLEVNQALLISEKVDGREYWLRKDLPELTETTNCSFLLSGFDEYLLGYKDRSAALATEHAQKVVPGSNGMFLSTIVIDGHVAGTWKRTIKKDHVLITLSPFKLLTKAAKNSLQEPLEAYGHFLGRPIKLG